MAKVEYWEDGNIIEIDDTDPRVPKEYTVTQEEIDAHKAMVVRGERDSLLNDTDWMAVGDRPISDEWKTYRQALRDLSQQSGFPNDVTFPTKPS